MKEENAKIGMAVICRNEEFSFGRLREGKEYIVEAAYDGTPIVIVNEAYHSMERFEKSEEVKP